MFLSPERPFFVVGNKRSGTTLLRYMLCAHPRIFIPPESNFIPRFMHLDGHEPMDRAQAVEVLKTILQYRMFFQDWQGPKPDPEAFIDELPDLRFTTLLNGLFSSYAGQNGALRWGDKTPLYTTHIDSLARLFPTSQFIHIIRDGRDVSLSMRQAYHGSRFFYIDTYYSARSWKRRLSEAIAAGARLGRDRYFEVRYEQLVACPEQILGQICEFLGESYEPQMVFPHEEAARHHHSKGIYDQTRQPLTTARVDRWRQSMSPADQRLFQRIAGEMLTSLGYETVDFGGMPLQERVRYLGLSAKYTMIETGRKVLKTAGVSHPMAVLSRKKGLRQSI